MSRRKLSQEDLALWAKVTEKAQRMVAPSLHVDHPPAKPKVSPARAAPPALGVFRVGQNAKPPPVRRDMPRDPLAHMPVQMDRREHQRLKRGKRDPEARIDLHGMTMDRAHPALTRFILTSQASGHRLVLVITGKGKGGDDPGPIPNPKGVLRHKVPDWLRLPPLGQAVLQISPAHQRHGGAGAYYVYLRRRR